MVTWYRESAPIRQKLLIVFATMTRLAVLAAMSASLGTFFGGLPVGLGMGLTFAVACALAGA